MIEVSILPSVTQRSSKIFILFILHHQMEFNETFKESFSCENWIFCISIGWGYRIKAAYPPRHHLLLNTKTFCFLANANTFRTKRNLIFGQYHSASIPTTRGNTSHCPHLYGYKKCSECFKSLSLRIIIYLFKYVKVKYGCLSLLFHFLLNQHFSNFPV